MAYTYIHIYTCLKFCVCVVICTGAISLHNSSRLSKLIIRNDDCNLNSKAHSFIGNLSKKAKTRLYKLLISPLTVVRTLITNGAFNIKGGLGTCISSILKKMGCGCRIMISAWKGSVQLKRVTIYVSLRYWKIKGMIMSC